MIRPAHARRSDGSRKVALYYPWVHLTSGAERTILELTGRSRHDWTIFTNHYDRGGTFPEFADRNIVELPRVSVRRSIGAVTRAALRVVTQRLPIDDYDALVVLSEGVGDLAMLRSARKPTVCICLTPLRPVFDPVYRHRALRARSRIGRTVLQAGSAAFAAVDRVVWRRYARVFCISDEVRRRAIAGRLATADRLDVLHVGIGVRPTGEEPTRFDRFFLIPGRIMWTKNLELGIAAFQRFRAERPEHVDYRLVLAGSVDDKSRPYLERLRALIGSDASISIQVAPSDAELRALYATCRGVLFTAFNEDWGIVPLEAMAFGKPVVAVASGGPRETIQHGVQGFLEAADPAAFAARLEQLAADDGRGRALGSAGRLRARQFSWTPFCDRIDSTIDALVVPCPARGDAPRPALAQPAGR